MITGAVTTIDAWFLTLTIVGQDVGDRMMMLVQIFLQKSLPEAFTGVSYLIGHSILEEAVKFIAFYIAFRIVKPTSIREIVFIGMVVGLGFATIESFAFYSAEPFHALLGFIIRAIGHGLFS
jgi:RsiW-degrading membrane proteinase PrsW (M82 family)